MDETYRVVAVEGVDGTFGRLRFRLVPPDATTEMDVRLRAVTIEAEATDLYGGLRPGDVVTISVEPPPEGSDPA